MRGTAPLRNPMKTSNLAIQLHVAALTLAFFSASNTFGQAPANDNFPAAEAIVEGAASTGSNANATAETGEPPAHWTVTYNAGTSTTTGRTVWYSYTPASSGLSYLQVLGVDATPAAFYGSVYTGSAVDALTRVASTSSTGGDSPPSNFFQATAGTTYFIQICGNSATASGAFSLTVTKHTATGTVVLPPNSNWEFLHSTLAANEPTADADWATHWKVPGDNSDYGAGALKFSAMLQSPLGFAALDGPPGVKTSIGTPTADADNGAGYYRASFTLAADTSNLWAQIVADDGAYIYIDNHAGVPVRIAGKLTGTSTTTTRGFLDYRPQDDLWLTGAIPTAAGTGTTVPGCRAYLPTGFNVERHYQTVFLGGLVGKLTAGTHTIAVSTHQTGSGSSDMAMDLQLLDMAPRPFPAGGLKTSFTEASYVAAAAAVPALEHHYAPRVGQSELAWYAASPATRGATALRQACVYQDTTSGSQNVLRLNGAEVNTFVTEPVSVAGKSQFSASIRILTRDTSSGFEAGDGFRVFLETSADGVNFSEPTPAVELQPQVNGAAALTPFQTGWVTKSSLVSGNTATAVRLVITGGTDSPSEYIYFDDVQFSDCQIFATASNIAYNNQGDNDPLNDTVTFDLTVTGSGTTGPGWTTAGFAPDAEATGPIDGTAVSISRPATDGTGARMNVVFSVVDDGNAACSTSVTVIPPAAAIGTITFSSVTRNLGADLADAADDSYQFTLDVVGTNTGAGYEIRSNDVGNTVLYATGTYGVTTAPITVPQATTGIVIVDLATPTLTKAATLNLAGVPPAMGRTNFGGVVTAVYHDPASVPTPDVTSWRQAIANGGDTTLVLDAYTTVLNPGATITAAEGTMATPAIDITGKSNVSVALTLRAFENSASGFETDDTMKIEIDVDTGGTVVTTNLIATDSGDTNDNDVLNGYTTSAAEPYDSFKERDEFNLALAAAAGSSSGTFDFTFNVPSGADKVTVRILGSNNSAAEKFFIQNLVIADNTSAPNADDDGDGVSNADEATAGTNPNDATSVFRIAGVTPDGATADLFHAGFPTVNGKFYQGYYSTDLQTWTRDDSAPAVAGTGADASWPFIPVPLAGQPKRFLIIMVSGTSGSFPATLP